MAHNLELPCKRSGYEPNGIDHDGYPHCFVAGIKVKHHRQAYCEHNNVTLEDIEGQYVLHKCDNKRCIEGTHLVLGTHADNMQDIVRRNGFGERWRDKSRNVKLTIEKVREIRARFREPRSVLMADYGVSGATLSEVISNKIWREEVIAKL